MGISSMPWVILSAKKVWKFHSLLARNNSDVPKGYFAVYVGKIQMKRFVVPVSYLKHPSFQDLLRYAEEEFGFHHPMGGLTIPCKEDVFVNLTAKLHLQR
ncbi:auxin-induced protein 15A-like [Apium graveolens]|uniref:auxin-induced protein 15A-like n=1 Tax=Apium graveolens TaxID=4045 RepID=UPI003D78CA4A